MGTVIFKSNNFVQMRTMMFKYKWVGLNNNDLCEFLLLYLNMKNYI